MIKKRFPQPSLRTLEEGVAIQERLKKPGWLRYARHDGFILWIPATKGMTPGGNRHDEWPLGAKPSRPFSVMPGLPRHLRCLTMTVGERAGHDDFIL